VSGRRHIGIIKHAILLYVGCRNVGAPPREDCMEGCMKRYRKTRGYRLTGMVLGLALLPCGLAASAQAQVLDRKEVSYAMAKTIAEGALENCKARGYGVSAVVVNRSGDTIVALRDDAAAVHTMENARRKAYTANTFRMTTEEFAKRMATEPVRREQTTLPSIIAIPGGVPIKIGNDTIGGVGVSGSPGVDEPCVQGGLDKVADQLK
jgi:uncharacterized protein GlcG (DUF336 family)